MLPEGTRIGEEVDSKSIAPQGVAGSSPVPSAYPNAPPRAFCFRGCFCDLIVLADEASDRRTHSVVGMAMKDAVLVQSARDS